LSGARVTERRAITISDELASAMIELVHARWGAALRNRDEDEPYWRRLQLQCEGVRNGMIERSLKIG
jgi:hypothetical protein